MAVLYRVFRVPVCVVLAVLSGAAWAEDPRFSLTLYGPSRDQVEVLVDTRNIPNDFVIQDARFDATFIGAAGEVVGRQSFDVTDSRLRALLPGHLYQRRFFHDAVAPQSIQSKGLVISRTALGDKADAPGQLITATSRPGGSPDIAIAPEAAGPSPGTSTATSPLILYWNAQRADNVTVAHPASIRAQIVTGGYQRVRTEGCILKQRLPGTRPLFLFWNAGREDNASVSHPDSIEAQHHTGGYRQVRVEGYVFERQQEGTIPLILFWNPGREDNVTVARQASIEAQIRTWGYQRVRIEGYIYPASQC